MRIIIEIDPQEGVMKSHKTEEVMRLSGQQAPSSTQPEQAQQGALEVSSGTGTGGGQDGGAAPSFNAPIAGAPQVPFSYMGVESAAPELLAASGMSAGSAPGIEIKGFVPEKTDVAEHGG